MSAYVSAQGVLTERVMRQIARWRSTSAATAPPSPSSTTACCWRFSPEGGSMLKPLYDPARIETFLEEFGLLFELADALGSALRLERARASATPAETSHPEIQHGFRGL